MANPRHRVRYHLVGQQYREAWLRDAGVFIQLCPRARGTDVCLGYEPGKHVLSVDIDLKPPPMYGSASTAVHDSESGSGLGGPGLGGPRSAPAAGGPGFADPSQGPVAGPPEADFAFDEPDDDVWPEDMRATEMDEGEAEARLRDRGRGEEGAADAEEEAEEDDGTDTAEGTAHKRGRDATIAKDHWNYDVMVIVDTIDIHQLGVAYCKCSAASHVPHDEQLLRYGGLFPATRKFPGTAFTLNGLAYHQIDRLEGRIAPWAMMRKLRRHTSPLHPGTVPVRPDQLYPCISS